jgi:biotin synthesis protein BioG
MKYKLIDNNSKQLIVFFNGWGMDSETLNHLDAENSDILTFYDYRGDLVLPAFSLKEYDRVYLIAWSMGVFVANQLALDLNLKIDKAIALCGSPYPVHDEYGISVKIFDITCKGLGLSGTDKFFKQMFVGLDNLLFNRPQRELLEQIDELENLKKISIDTDKKAFSWDLALVGTKDRIFPSKNLIAYWEGKTRLIKEEIPHYPFDKYDTWSKILSI